ncbi:ENV7 (YPL236C) [Zygosaccharomyces parabailii]|nr:ENV7 (YPL236C) [Zygosaccharomyces parabailii]CDH12854.1 probable Serine/threonine-protein kinase ENV7 [Zygosaccharomyces bailii ISA1307]
MEATRQLFKLFCGTCCCCCDYSESYVSINGRRYSIRKLLGEGSFSFIYLVQLVGSVTSSNGLSGGGWYALKRIRCPFGNIESISAALKEVDNYKRFQSPYVVPLVDSQVAQERDGSKTVFVLLPYFPLGSLQDSTSRNLLNGTFISESECVRIMIGIARGLRCLHDPSSRSQDSQPSQEQDAVSMSYSDEAALLLEDTPLELDILSSAHTLNSSSYAHRDMKPSNILFSSDGLPVISDLGSCSKADLTVTTRAQLNELQEWVLEHCTLQYTAPELLDVTLNTSVGTKVDIWSLGCTCYFMLFGISPFEREEQVSGASLKYAICTGKFSFPQQHRYSSRLIHLIKTCLHVDPAARPDINDLLTSLQELQVS